MPCAPRCPRFWSFGLFLLAAAPAAAEPVRFSYQTDIDTMTVPTPNGQPQPAYGYVYVQSIGGAEPAGVHMIGVDATACGGTAAYLRAVGLRTFYDLSPDSYRYGLVGALNFGDYDLHVRLTDAASQTTGTLTFTGRLDGEVFPDYAAVTNRFTGPVAQTLELGGHTYRVALGAYAAPGRPGHAEPTGYIAAQITVDGDAFAAPEPSGLLLLGLALCGGRVFVRRRTESRRAGIE